MIKDYFAVFLFLICISTSFFVGYRYSKDKCDLMIAEINTQSSKLNVEQLENEVKTIYKQMELSNATSKEIKTNYSLIDNDFNNLFTDDLWVSVKDSDSSNKEPLSDTTSTTNRVSSTEYGRNEAYKQDIQRLYQQVLEIGRDYDQCVVRQNELINLYNKLRTEN